MGADTYWEKAAFPCRFVIYNYFPFHLNMLTNTQTPKLNLILRWKDETLIPWVIKRSCRVCSQVGYE